MTIALQQHTAPPTLSGTFGSISIPADRHLTFGRGVDTDVRIGAEPTYDNVVPRTAGRLLLSHGRVVVENLHAALAFDVRVEDRPLRSVAPGEIYSPPNDAFEIVVTGGVTSYRLLIGGSAPRAAAEWAIERDGRPPSDPDTTQLPKLNPRQRAILDAYVRPLQHGGGVASHQAVAEAVHISRSLVRVECERIWQAMFSSGTPMRPLGVAKDEIVDAWARHRL